MIIVVEGVSAAGKTTWCQTQRIGEVVPEQIHVDTGSVQWESRPDVHAAQNVRRWRQALSVERSAGVVVCDTDPFKLHYSWCELQSGLISEEYWMECLDVAREAFANGDLGFADAVLFLDPPSSTVRLQREQDLSRTRRRFEKHLSFRPWLKEWYIAVDRLDMGRVHWEPAPDLMHLTPRATRSGIAVFDRFIHLLTGSRSRTLG